MLVEQPASLPSLTRCRDPEWSVSAHGAECLDGLRVFLLLIDEPVAKASPKIVKSQAIPMGFERQHPQCWDLGRFANESNICLSTPDSF